MLGICCKVSCYWNLISRLFPPHLSRPTSCPSLRLPQATPQTKPVFSLWMGPCTLGPGRRSNTAAELSSPPASISRLGSNTSAAVIRSTTTFFRYLNEVFHCRVPPLCTCNQSYASAFPERFDFVIPQETGVLDQHSQTRRHLLVFLPKQIPRTCQVQGSVPREDEHGSLKTVSIK